MTCVHIVFTMDHITKDITFTGRMDCYVHRDGRLVKVATGTITHAYLVIRNRGIGSDVVKFDKTVREALASFRAGQRLRDGQSGDVATGVGVEVSCSLAGSGLRHQCISFMVRSP